MKTRATTLFMCSNCGSESAAWLGRCPVCGEWNTLQEVPAVLQGTTRSRTATPTEPVRLSTHATAALPRIKVGVGELDGVLGGGLVAGSISVFGGEPGIGKSTLLLHVAVNLAHPDLGVLYCSGEENIAQVAGRYQRLGSKNTHTLFVELEDVDAVIETARAQKAKLLIVDSIQTLSDATVNSSPGSLGQVRTCTLKLARFAKESGTIVLLIGHITKEGTLAGPKTLEHIVDAVFSIEGDRTHAVRIVRTLKNRFGPVDEVALFTMSERGMLPATDPSEILLKERVVGPGSVVTAILEGSRSLLVEIQALTSPSITAYPRRVATGFDSNRLSILTAILGRRANLKIDHTDIFVNVVGGLRVTEPAADFGVCLAIASAAFDQGVDPKLVVWGEVGLAGEIRAVPFEDRRAKEVERLKLTPFKRPRELKIALNQLLGKAK